MKKLCLYCNKEYEAKRETAKYCSDRCRKLAFLKSSDSVLVPQKVSVPENSVPRFSDKVGSGVCHGCGIAVDKIVCICSNCVQKGITHEKLGLDIKNCK